MFPVRITWGERFRVLICLRILFWRGPSPQRISLAFGFWRIIWEKVLRMWVWFFGWENEPMCPMRGVFGVNAREVRICWRVWWEKR